MISFDDPSRFFLLIAGGLILCGFLVALFLESRHQRKQKEEDQ